MIWENVTKFGQNFIATPIFFWLVRLWWQKYDTGVPEKFLARRGKFKTKAPFFVEVEKIVVKVYSRTSRKNMGDNSILPNFYGRLPEL